MSGLKSENEIVIEYQFKFEDESSKTFEVILNTETLVSRPKVAVPPEEWTKLDFHKCKHCPYTSDKMPHCPAAVNLAAVADTYKAEKSFRKTTAFVRMEDRIYGKQTDIQTGLQSLFGLVMATSGCKHLDFFKPLARYHLPFSGFEENMMRVLGHYLIVQFLKTKHDKEADWTGESLADIYGQINQVNKGIIERIRSIAKGDADKNALIILDSFASLLPLEMSNGFEGLEGLYKHLT